MVGRCAVVVVTVIGCSSAPKPETRTAPAVSPADARDVQIADAGVPPIDAASSRASAAPPANLYEACKRDQRQACDALATLCDGGDAASCAELGNVYWLGVGATRDDVKAKALFARACKVPGGPFDGCVELTEIECRTDDKPKQRAAISTLDRACDGKFARACAYAGLIYAEGLCAVPYNAGSWSLGVRYYQRACDLGSLGGCTHLGLLYRAGHGVTKDEARGKRLLDDACRRGDTAACEYARQP